MKSRKSAYAICEHRDFYITLAKNDKIFRLERQINIIIYDSFVFKYIEVIL